MAMGADDVALVGAILGLIDVLVRGANNIVEKIDTFRHVDETLNKWIKKNTLLWRTSNVIVVLGCLASTFLKVFSSSSSTA